MNQAAREIFKEFAYLNFTDIDPLPKQLSLFDLITGQNSIRVNPKLIKKEIDEGFTKELAFYYLLKFYFLHSRISYADKPKELISSLSGLSIKTINKYFDALCFHNLLKVHPWGWELITNKSKGRFKIIVGDKPTMYEIKNLLLSKVLEREGNKQALYDSLKLFITDGDRGKKSLGKMKPEAIYKPRFSIRYIAKILNISYRTTIKLVKELNLMGVIKTESSDPKFMLNCQSKALKYLDGMQGYRYMQSGALYEIQPSTHEFLQHPIKSKEMTLKRYKAITKDPAIRKFVDEVNQLSDY